MPSHRKPSGESDPHLRPVTAPADPYIAAGVVHHLIYLRFALIGANVMGAVGFIINRPGNSPSLALFQVLASLPVWAGLFAATAILLVAGRWSSRLPSVGYLVGTVAWGLYAAGAVIGLAIGSTPSPSATLVLAGLVSTVAAFHVLSLRWRRRLELVRGKAARG